MDAMELVALLREKVDECGGICKFSDRHDISMGYISNVLYCGAKPGPMISRALGYRKVIRFEPIKGLK